jgi:hypothetical protein
MLKITFLHIVYENGSELDETSEVVANTKRRLEWLSHVIRMEETNVAKTFF